ncbi:MAG: dimethylamine corrinoid protein 3 [Candidatus Latescibacteria bacterium]|nr:dimethylamine corrinoid protein 3 [Candidatus Latescibacterota bacterium]NIM66306.1 dimethylamine corrinoid protein 3 [Candidatus Latescibacterota bacterium]NIO02785.1 dimethylamine corrinoid protein 3 [Candidatus Latescibacterota bacterium]NIO29920.1 dimethylamine corrinoid protein 3 [Candidatus Latescibacterota bacterium]NIO57535.1 dimethylamine corrinoid protein 3 [Candidatus Latescibacterota bacterium]
MQNFLAQCEEAVLKGEKARAVDLAASALDKGYDLLEVIEGGFSKGIRKAGELWEKGEYFLPELAFSAEAMKDAMEVLQPGLLESSEQSRTKGKVVIGTIQGDIHDIGKTLVATMLAANGYNVIDLGADVAYSRFIEEVKNQKPELLCMSALLTTTMAGQGHVISQLEEGGLRSQVKVMVGGAPTTAAWAEEIGADGYAENAVEAVQKANSLLI